MKARIGLHGRALVVDARDFVDGYTVMMENGGWEFINVKFGDTQSLEERERKILVRGETLTDESLYLDCDY